MRRLVLVVFLVAIAGSATASASALPGTVPKCRAGQLHAALGSSSGAAGTIALAIVLRNGGTACTMKGYAGLRLANASGPLPTRVRHGGLSFLNGAPQLVTLQHNGRATVLVTYSDVPTGSETTCPTSTKLLVRPPGRLGSVPVGVEIGACNRGLLRESPVLRGVRQAP